MITMPCAGFYGRLGNFMWQFAAGYAHAKRTGQEFVIPPSDYTQYLSNLPKWVKITDQIPQMPSHYEEPCFAYKPIPRDLRNASIRGYFQSVRHWEDCARDAWRIFCGHDWLTQGCEALARQLCEPADAVAWCVRRTDYLQPDRIKFHGVLGNRYYHDAMQHFPEKTFVVFSDDIEWCKKMYGDPSNNGRWIFCEEKDHWLKLWMIANCQGGAIIANSTYHGWGAWLGWFMDQDRPVVWPKAWFGPTGPNAETDDICPKEWERI